MDEITHSIKHLKTKNVLTSQRGEWIFRQVNYNKLEKCVRYNAVIVEQMKDHLREGEFGIDISSSSSTHLTRLMGLMVGVGGTVIRVVGTQEISDQITKQLTNDSKNVLDSKVIKVITLDELYLLSEHAPFNFIHINFYMKTVPIQLVDLLKPGGRLLMKKLKYENSVTLVQVDKLMDGGMKVKELETARKCEEDKRLSTSCLLINDNKNRNAEKFICYLCSLRLQSPTSLCVNGHIACCNCNEVFKICKCKGFLLKISNAHFDKILDSVLIKCKGKNYGCKEEKLNNCIEEHEKLCPYLQNITCVQCQEIVKCGLYGNHIYSLHADRIGPDKFPLSINFEMLLSKWDDKKLCIFKKDVITSALFQIEIQFLNEKFSITCKYIGPPESHKKYEFRVHLKQNLNEFKIVNSVQCLTTVDDSNLTLYKDICEKFFSAGGKFHIVFQIDLNLDSTY